MPERSTRAASALPMPSAKKAAQEALPKAAIAQTLPWWRAVVNTTAAPTYRGGGGSRRAALPEGVELARPWRGEAQGACATGAPEADVGGPRGPGSTNARAIISARWNQNGYGCCGRAHSEDVSYGGMCSHASVGHRGAAPMCTSGGQLSGENPRNSQHLCRASEEEEGTEKDQLWRAPRRGKPLRRDRLRRSESEPDSVRPRMREERRASEERAREVGVERALRR